MLGVPWNITDVGAVAGQLGASYGARPGTGSRRCSSARGTAAASPESSAASCCSAASSRLEARRGKPAAAVGFVNGCAVLVILVCAPLVGLTFWLPGDGRLGFVAIGLLWATALLAVRRARRE